MKSRLRERFWWTAAVVLMAAVLVTLGVLQYRWSGAVSEAASVRMQASLQSSIWGFRQEFHRDLASLCPPVRGAGSPAEVATQLADWDENNAEHGDLLAQLYWWQGVGGPHPHLQRFDTATHAFAAAEWPREYQPLAQGLAHVSSHMQMMMMPPRGVRPDDHGAGEPRSEDHMRRMAMRHGGPVCMLDQSVPALVRHLPPAADATSAAPDAHDWLVVILDRRTVAAKLLPELAGRFFGGQQGLEFDVAVVSADSNDTLYTSDPSFHPRAGHVDATTPLFGFPLPPGSRTDAMLITVPRPDAPPNAAAGTEVPRLGMMGPGSEHDWQLFVRHRNGSLEQLVARARARDRAISFGILLVLAITMALLLLATHRAHRLARLQMDFVAGVSHELRTPLTVIAAAADNLSDGIIAGGPQVARYGSAIKEQAEQLKQLVEQILLFAATRDANHRYNLRAVAVQDIVATAVSNTAELVRGAGVTVETEFAPELPPVLADPSAGAQALQNLITNAVKYGGEKRWVRIRAHAAGGERGREVQISVADKGIGLRGRELQRVFEPFYRGDQAISAQIHGTGLGLTLARNIAEAMGGAITVQSSPAEGTVFTLHLPAAEVGAAAAQPAAAMTEK